MTRTTLFFGAFLAFAFLFTISDAGSIRERRQAIPREFQNINIEDYLKNTRAVQFQIKCVTGEGQCDRLGKYLKIAIPDFLTSQCQNCTPQQRKQIGILVSHMQQHYKKEWAAAVKKYIDEGGQEISAAAKAKLKKDYGIKIDASPNEN